MLYDTTSTTYVAFATSNVIQMRSTNSRVLVQLDIDPSGTDLEKNLSKNSRFLENKQEIMANNLFLILEKVMLFF